MPLSASLHSVWHARCYAQAKLALPRPDAGHSGLDEQQAHCQRRNVRRGLLTEAAFHPRQYRAAAGTLVAVDAGRDWRAAEPASRRGTVQQGEDVAQRTEMGRITRRTCGAHVYSPRHGAHHQSQPSATARSFGGSLCDGTLHWQGPSDARMWPLTHPPDYGL